MTPTNGGNGDSGTQPEPHYCTTRPRANGTREGCPDWPGCLFSPPAPPAALNVAIIEADEPTLWTDLASLAGFVVGTVLTLTVAALLLPLFVL